MFLYVLYFQMSFLENQPFVSLIMLVSSEATLIQIRIEIVGQVTLNKGPIGITYDTVPGIEYILQRGRHIWL